MRALLINASYPSSEFPTIPLGLAHVAALLEKEGVELIYEQDDLLSFSGGKYIDNTVQLWSFNFYNDWLYNVDVVFDTIDGQDSAIWHKALNYLQNNYGKTDKYQKIDRNKTAIYWIFFDGDEAESMIQLIRTFRGNLESEIQITYTYLPLLVAKEELDE